MEEYKVLMSYNNCYFNGGCHCMICGHCFESGGIEFGFELMSNGKIDSGSAICPECMKEGPEGWRKTLLEKAKQKREYAKDAERIAIEQAKYYESFSEADFILPSEEEEKNIRKEFPGEWALSEYEEKQGQKIWHVLSVRGKRTGEVRGIDQTLITQE